MSSKVIDIWNYDGWKIDSNKVAMVQRNLVSRPLDGPYGPKTIQAIKDTYERNKFSVRYPIREKRDNKKGDDIFERV